MNDQIFTQAQVDEIVDFLSKQSTETKLYFGCDSVRFMKEGVQYAKFATVLIVHINGKNGCRIFANKAVERDYDMKANRPKMRMMNEVIRVCSLYKQLMPHIEQFSELVELPNGDIQVKEFDVEIHLDINTDPKHGSNCAAKEAAGYVLGITGIEPKLKPESWAASFGADAVANKSTKIGT